jgi:hypothetical protein
MMATGRSRTRCSDIVRRPPLRLVVRGQVRLADQLLAPRDGNTGLLADASKVPVEGLKPAGDLGELDRLRVAQASEDRSALAVGAPK